MDRLSQISIENTVSVKVDCIFNQQLLAKNFAIILNALKDLKNQQDKHSATLKDMSNLKDLFNKLHQEHNNMMNHIENIGSNSNNNQNSHSQNNNKANNETHFDKTQSSKDKTGNNLSNSDLLKQIEKLKDKLNKHDGFIIENTKDINILTKDMNNVKDEIEKLKMNLNNLKGNNSDNSNNANLNKNFNLDMESIRNINNQAQKTRDDLNKLLNQMENMKKKMSNLQNQLENLKNNQNNQNNQHSSLNDKNDKNDKTQNNSSSKDNNNNSDNNRLNDLLRKIQNIQKKLNDLQDQTHHNSKDINGLKQETEKNNQNIDLIHQEIKKINNILNRLQNIHNADQSNLQGEIDRIKQNIALLLKMIDQINKNMNRPGSSSSKQQNQKTGKSSIDRSFRIRSDSTVKEDLNGKINEINGRLNYLEKMIGSKSNIEDPEKLPNIKNMKKDFNQTGFKDSKSYKKDLADIKHDLELWIKSYLVHQQKGQDLGELQLKIQEIKNNLNKKADHEGMKKGLAFLQGKITQIFMFLTEPESEDAMIVRKGFNCLSCSKKVQSLRGKLGPRMNWDNLNTTNFSHTPPKTGYHKYGQSPQKEYNNNYS